jgi:hypothetical protein
MRMYQSPAYETPGLFPAITIGLVAVDALMAALSAQVSSGSGA